MYPRLSQRQKIIKQAALYTGMALTVVLVVTFIVMVMLGFRFNTDKGNLEQYAFLQFNSAPSGATVTVGGKVIGSRTPNKTSLPAGKYEVVIWRDGYETWRKTVDLKSGTLTWLDYALLVPKKLGVEAVANYDVIYSTSASPDGHYMLVQKSADVPTFELADLSLDTVKSTELIIPKKEYSESSTIGITHNFKIDSWDAGGRYVLVKHTYGDKNEWLVVDTQNTDLTKNITQLFNLSFSNIKFSGTSGNMLYVLDVKDIRKLDLSAGTMSRSLVTNVTNFDLYDSNIITYIGNDATGAKVAGLYREGDESPYVYRVITDNTIPVYIATTRYFNEDYVVVTEGKKVDILGGSYQNATTSDAMRLKAVASFEVKETIRSLSFSPVGQYLFIQSGADFTSYDLEYKTLISSTVDNTGAISPLKWLDDSYLWSDNNGNLSIREFDGANVHSINSVLTGQDAALTHNGRYLYSINKSSAGYQLQRVRMVLP